MMLAAGPLRKFWISIPWSMGWLGRLHHIAMPNLSHMIKRLCQEQKASLIASYPVTFTDVNSMKLRNAISVAQIVLNHHQTSLLVQSGAVEAMLMRGYLYLLSSEDKGIKPWESWMSIIGEGIQTQKADNVCGGDLNIIDVARRISCRR